MAKPPDSGTRDRPIVELTISAPADEVWSALRDPQRIYNWFGWDAETLKDEIDFIFVEHATADDSARVVRFDGMNDRFEVIPRGGHCVLSVVRAAPAADDSWDDIYESTHEGWISFVQQLRLALEQHGLGPRRTIYVSGNAKRAGGPLPSEALGVTRLRDAAPGDAYRTRFPTGDHVQGTVWHRTRFQLGLTVPQWSADQGQGLLIATDIPPTEKPPNGGGALCLTTYGLADDDFAALEAGWNDWWNARFAPGADALG